jgi:hypothetical protein
LKGVTDRCGHALRSDRSEQPQARRPNAVGPTTCGNSQATVATKQTRDRATVSNAFHKCSRGTNGHVVSMESAQARVDHSDVDRKQRFVLTA